MVEIDGDGVSPETVDSLSLLRFAETSLRLITKLAESARLGLTFQGLQVLDKCAAVAAMPSDGGSAKLAAVHMLRVVRGDEEPPKGTEGLVEEMRRQLRELPAHQRAGVRLGAWAQRLHAPALPVAERPWETTELRVVPIRVGGQNPTAALSSESEPEPFVVHVKLDDARALGAALHRPIDVLLNVRRGADGRIDAGEVVEVIPLGDADPAQAWRAWFAENADGWDDIDDVRGALGRGKRD